MIMGQNLKIELWMIFVKKRGLRESIVFLELLNKMELLRGEIGL